MAAGAAAQAPERKTFELSLVDGKVAAGPGTVRVRRHDEVELRWSSDRRIVLHLHGYDIERTVAPGAPAAMAFKADIAGRFPVTEHAHGVARHHRAVLYLEVRP